MMRTRISIGLALAGATIGIALLAPAARAQLTIDWYTVDGGGHTFSTGGALQLGGTAGQPDAGYLSGGSLGLFGGFWRGGEGVSGIDEEVVADQMPGVLKMGVGRPNPFRESTRIDLELPVSEPVRIEIFDLTGRLVRTLHDDPLPAGRHDLVWDGRADGGERLPCGVYLVRARAGNETIRRQLVLLR